MRENTFAHIYIAIIKTLFMNTEIWISCMFYGSKIFSSFDFFGAFEVVQIICSPYKIQKYAVGQIWLGLELPDPQVKETLNISLFFFLLVIECFEYPGLNKSELLSISFK